MAQLPDFDVVFVHQLGDGAAPAFKRLTAACDHLWWETVCETDYDRFEGEFRQSCLDQTAKARTIAVKLRPLEERSINALV
jgi:hypothetical protein